MKEKLGFIGLGNMGRPMAERLVRGGHELQVYDIDPRAKESFSAQGAKSMRSPCDLARECTIIMLCLPNSKIVEEVVLGAEGIIEGARNGSVVIDMTTANPLSTRSLDVKLREKGLEMLDAPVSGGPTGAQGGTLAVMVGGKKEVFERCRPFLAVIAPKNLTYVGPIGWGHTIKAINNFMNAVQRWITTEAVALAVKAGVPVQKAVEVLQMGTARNYSLDATFPNYILTEKIQGFTAGLMHKDVGISTEMALELGVPMPMGNHIRGLFEFLIWLDGPDQEINHYVRYIEKWAGIRLRNREEEGYIAPKNLSHVGKIGTDHVMELASHIIGSTNLWAVSEGIVLATKAGLSPRKVLEVINVSSGRSYHTEIVFPQHILTGKIPQGFSIGLACKDIDLAVELARNLRVPFFVGNKTREVYRAVMSKRGPEQDVNEVLTEMEDDAGVKVREG